MTKENEIWTRAQLTSNSFSELNLLFCLEKKSGIQKRTENKEYFVDFYQP